MLVLTPNNDYVFETRHGKLDPSDDHNLDYKVIKETWVENVYRITEDKFYDSKIFIDVGANIGSVSLYVDSFNKDKAKDEQIKTYAIEPEPHNLRLLHKNISANPNYNLTVVPNAIDIENHIVKISNRGGNSSIFERPNTKYTEVEAFTFDKLFNLYNIFEVDFMKIDIEGLEYDLLINTPLEILAKIKYIALEFDKDLDNKFGEMINKLAKQFGIEILGSPERGGYVYCTRY